MGRALATIGALSPIAAAAVTTGGNAAMPPVPTVWHVLGYPFEAGSMIAALCACAAVRFYVVQKEYKQHRWTLDAPISALALMFTAGAVIRLRPDPSVGLFYGTVFGILGAGIIAIAKKNVDRVLGALDLIDTTPPPT
jgi:hypothetical protein